MTNVKWVLYVCMYVLMTTHVAKTLMETCKWTLLKHLRQCALQVPKIADNVQMNAVLKSNDDM